ncbi:hypothetical protein AAFF_G00437740 [Aldrovandia affinis]|uniref:Uncharacterized protein n=1 Tax=Aldrovandia affinis TaxID=143900 RepID=A0AAD7WHZ3_9TELE|nr:hypothetical protein AAFF_G00437740 [Aldrovandia affinis]
MTSQTSETPEADNEAERKCPLGDEHVHREDVKRIFRECQQESFWYRGEDTCNTYLYKGKERQISTIHTYTHTWSHAHAHKHTHTCTHMLTCTHIHTHTHTHTTNTYTRTHMLTHTHTPTHSSDFSFIGRISLGSFLCSLFPCLLGRCPARSVGVVDHARCGRINLILICSPIVGVYLHSAFLNSDPQFKTGGVPPTSGLIAAI